MGLSGCKTADMDDITGSIGVPSAPASNSPEDLRIHSELLRKRYEANPGDKTIAMNYARILRARGLSDQGAAVLENVAVKAPNDSAVLAAYGKALADAGGSRRRRRAGPRLLPRRPNWSCMSARGSIADQLGDHAGAGIMKRAEACAGRTLVLSNLGLSYALSQTAPRRKGFA